jgi:hypothetical protein
VTFCPKQTLSDASIVAVLLLEADFRCQRWKLKGLWGGYELGEGYTLICVLWWTQFPYRLLQVAQRFVVVDRVIPPFLMGSSRRIQAAVLSFIAGVMPPMPMLGRSLL